MSNALLLAEVKAALLARFPDAQVNVIDDSAAHLGHSVHGGAAHLRVEIGSAALVWLSLIQQHRLIYQTLDPFMVSRVHALQIKILENPL